MKRDMDLVRQILITIEDYEHGFAPEAIEVPGYTEETIGYHLVLMEEAGLVRADVTTAFGEQRGAYGRHASLLQRRVFSLQRIDAQRFRPAFARIQVPVRSQCSLHRPCPPLTNAPNILHIKTELNVSHGVPPKPSERTSESV